ncbi:MAG TPA: tRNA pseudouridine synthase A [Planctomycetaceae bacterium]|nr:tRNA pseudouridine synthase A [Planctomycetaceae bacterium]
MRTLCLTLAYDGAAYCGWQRQPDGRSLQDVVERALSKFTGERIHVAASGRTDARVHAVGQLVSFHTATDIPVEGFRWGLVTKLPDDIVVRDVVEQPYGFHARFDAVRKRYRYVIHSARTPSPFLRNYVWWHRGPLDDRAMQTAADVLVGTHDFRCFETNWPNRSSSVRTVFEAKWTRCSEWEPWGDGQWSVASGQLLKAEEGDVSSQLTTDDGLLTNDFLCLDITADGFLYNMVRAIVGTLVHVGRGRWTADDVLRILDSGDRRVAGDTAPPQGLYLMEVQTVVDEQRIAERVARYRARMANDQGSMTGEGDLADEP